MSKTKKLFRSSFLVLALLTVGTPAAFAATDVNTIGAQQDEGFDWALLGLVGLIGLAGLRGGSKGR